MEIIYIIAGVVGAIGIVYVVQYFKNERDINIIRLIDNKKTALNLVKLITKDMDIYDEHLKQIIKTTFDAVEYIEAQLENETDEKRINEGVQYVKEQLVEFDIELTEYRKEIIEMIFPIAYDIVDKFYDEILE